jgi:hypothetical protein
MTRRDHHILSHQVSKPLLAERMRLPRSSEFIPPWRIFKYSASHCAESILSLSKLEIHGPAPGLSCKNWDALFYCSSFTVSAPSSTCALPLKPLTSYFASPCASEASINPTSISTRSWSSLSVSNSRDLHNIHRQYQRIQSSSWSGASALVHGQGANVIFAVQRLLSPFAFILKPVGILDAQCYRHSQS